MPVVQIDKLENICTRIFEGAGLTDEEAQRIAHSLVLSNLMGHDSHGVIRVTQYIKALKDGIVHADQRIKKIRESDASAVVDGGWGFGQTGCGHPFWGIGRRRLQSRGSGQTRKRRVSHGD